MECELCHWLMPGWLLQFEVVAHVVSRCMHSMFLTADTRSFKDSLSLPINTIINRFWGGLLAPLGSPMFFSVCPPGPSGPPYDQPLDVGIGQPVQKKSDPTV